MRTVCVSSENSVRLSQRYKTHHDHRSLPAWHRKVPSSLHSGVIVTFSPLPSSLSSTCTLKAKTVSTALALFFRLSLRDGRLAASPLPRFLRICGSATAHSHVTRHRPQRSNPEGDLCQCSIGIAGTFQAFFSCRGALGPGLAWHTRSL